MKSKYVAGQYRNVDDIEIAGLTKEFKAKLKDVEKIDVGKDHPVIGVNLINFVFSNSITLAQVVCKIAEGLGCDCKVVPYTKDDGSIGYRAVVNC